MNLPPLLDSTFLACPMCMSGASGQELMAANSAIFLMLVVLVAVLSAFFGFIVYLAKRAHRFAEEIPAHPSGQGDHNASSL